MINNYSEEGKNKLSVDSTNFGPVRLARQGGGAGDPSNDRITTCNICRNNGFPHEAIEFEKVNGRVLSDGTHEVASWKLRDYFTGRKHEHRQKEMEFDE